MSTISKKIRIECCTGLLMESQGAGSIPARGSIVAFFRNCSWIGANKCTKFGLEIHTLQRTDIWSARKSLIPFENSINWFLYEI